MKLVVEGMSCGHCVKTVIGAIHKVDANAEVTVDLPAGTVNINGGVTRRQAAQAIQDCGYNVTAAEA